MNWLIAKLHSEIRRVNKPLGAKINHFKMHHRALGKCHPCISVVGAKVAAPSVSFWLLVTSEQGKREREREN